MIDPLIGLIGMKVQATMVFGRIVQLVLVSAARRSWHLAECVQLKMSFECVLPDAEVC